MHRRGVEHVEMIYVPSVFQNLVALHGIDASTLGAELRGKVRTRTWPGTATDRAELLSLPPDFPRFKGRVVDGRLRLEAMRLTQDIVITSGAMAATMTMPHPALPEAVIGALEGRRLSDLIGHPAIGRDVRIVDVQEEARTTGRQLVLGIQMPLVVLGSTSANIVSGRKSADAPDMQQLIARTHRILDDAPRLTRAAVLDPRLWQTGLGTGLRIMGVRAEESPIDGHVVEIRFPYDRRMAATIGRSGIGAWFDRSVYAWRMMPTERGLEGLSHLLSSHADIVVDGAGRLYIPHQD